MATRLNPYISFKDNAAEAMEFYKSVFGGKLSTTAFKDGGMPYDESDRDKLMHAVLETGNGLVLMAADTPSSMEYKAGSNISISLSGEDETELRSYYDKLSGSGTLTYPLEKAPWGDFFGMCVDKYGVSWMVNINAASQ